MDRNPPELLAHQFAFTRVQASPRLDPKRSDVVGDCAGTAHGASRAVESGAKAIAGGVDLPPAKSRKLAPHHRVVIVEQVAPTTVAKAT